MRAHQEPLRGSLTTNEEWKKIQHEQLTKRITTAGSVSAGVSSFLGLTNPFIIAGFSTVANFLTMITRTNRTHDALNRDVDMQQDMDLIEGTHQAPIMQAAANKIQYDLAAHAACTGLGQTLAIAYAAPYLTSMLPPGNAAAHAMANMTVAAGGSYIGSLAYHAGKAVAESCWTERVFPRTTGQAHGHAL